MKHQTEQTFCNLPRSALSTAAMKVVFAFCPRVIAVAVLLWHIAGATRARVMNHACRKERFLGSDEFQNGRTAIIDTFLIPRRRVAAQCFCHSFVSPLCLGTIGASCPAAPLPVRCVTLFFHVLPLHKWLFYPWTFVFKHWTLIVQSWV